jgi:hypothetical protein
MLLIYTVYGMTLRSSKRDHTADIHCPMFTKYFKNRPTIFPENEYQICKSILQVSLIKTHILNTMTTDNNIADIIENSCSPEVTLFP